MQKIVLVVLVFCFLAGLFGRVGCEGEDHRISGRQIIKELSDFDPNAIVILAYLGRYQRGTTPLWPRVAFVIGDGTLLLTAAHCVQDLGDRRQQAVSPTIVAISPYYGDIFDFEVLAVDEEADLAILKASWITHPALSLGTEEQLEAAKRIVIAGRPCTPLGGLTRTPWKLSPGTRAERLPILRLNYDDPENAVMLKGTRRVVEGWSGSALVLPDTGKAIGVLGKLHRDHRRNDASGCGIRSISALLEEHKLQFRADARPPQLTPVEDAKQAFGVAIDYVECLINWDLPGSVDVARQLVALRPQSVQAHLFLAFSAHDTYTVRSSTDELRSLAESSFKKALALAPENARAHAGYSSFLMVHHRHEEALKETETALAIDPNNELALANRILILTQTDPNRAEQLARRLVEKDPNNPHRWYWYCRALAKLRRDEEALEAAQKAVELNPEGTYYGSLANALDRLGRIDDAEPHYKDMTERCGCQHCWYKYADFLVDHRPEKLDEAEKALDKAEAKKAIRVPRKNLNVLRLSLLKKKSPEEAEAFARRLLEESPENGRYWWTLADILRTQGKHQDAVEAARKAVQLSPDGNYRPRLANCLGKAGQLDEAEQTYNQMFQNHPERAKYWFWYAQFLCDYFPDRLDEARQALSKAQTLRSEWPVLPEDLTKLQEEIESKAKTADDGTD
jgi:pentatricopeptide repeat protein